ncbi:hypothetical protein [Capillimicrobium parvum]|uniref:Uncharacterized protein n=1 Tax=Capillimicrobium parvum TaxID=2884022 RepID=A0A9E6Y0E8_9ACTN|nr:hypothetical protein [Capillimicrobium parvum]UGS37877.1 hypothetical protein DSM104329_04298 [Capillimicrobium parvum]
MSTSVQHRPDQEHPEPGAQSLMIWLGAAMLAVTVAIIIGITQFGATAGVGVAFGALVIAVVGIFAYIVRFIGPED